MRTVVKICGLTREQDVAAAIAAGADAIGLVFARSPRQVVVESARQLLRQVPAGITRIGLFLDQGQDEVEAVLEQLSLDMLQFHGSENSAYCGLFGLPYLKAVSVHDGQSVLQAAREFAAAAGLLLDSHVRGGRGGSGKQFDWHLAEPVSQRIWLAGGLHAGNVAAAIHMLKPYAVDVSSGVEIRPGIKDPDKIQAFIRAVRQQEKQTTEGHCNG